MSAYPTRIGLLLLAALALVAGCMPAPAPIAPPQDGQARASYPPPLTADQRVSISFANYNVASAGIGKEATEELVAEFTRAHPNIEVTFRPIPSGELMAKTQADVVAGNPPDLAQLIMADLEFVANDLRAKPIDTLVPPDEYQAYVKGEYPLHPRGLKLTELEGRTYGIPYVFSTPTLFYNADLFRQAGLDPDKPPTTWTEVKQSVTPDHAAHRQARHRHRVHGRWRR